MPRQIIVKKKVGFRCKPRSRSRSAPGPTVRPHSAKGSASQTLASSLGVSYGSYLKTEQVYTYIQRVKDTFRRDLGVYHQFVKIIGDIQNPGQCNILDLVDEVGQLFDGYPDLIYGFNTFLPNNYEIEVQKDAVIVKVYEKTDDSAFWDAKGRARQEHFGAVGYIQELKHTLAYDPHKYQEFMDILSDFHSKKIDETATVRKVVRVLVDHPHLVLGFNEFLPEGYAIHMYNENSYTFKHPGKKNRTNTVNINLC